MPGSLVRYPSLPATAGEAAVVACAAPLCQMRKAYASGSVTTVQAVVRPICRERTLGAMKATPDNPRRLGNGRGRRGLDRDAIVRTARRITRKHGFDALSMPTLARELGVGTMSIYRHVPDKRSLVGLVVDSFLSEVEVPPASMGSWDERLLALKRNLIKAYARVPGMATASLESTPGPEATRLLDAHYRILLDAGFSGPEAVRAYSTLLIFTLGALVSERIGMPAAAAGTDGRADGYSAIKQVAAAAAEMDRSTSIDVGLAVIVAALARELADKATGDKPATATARPGARGAGKSGDDRSPILATGGRQHTDKGPDAALPP